MNILQIMQAGPVIPVIVIDDATKAVPLARALVEGGVRVLEVTLRTPAALDAVREISKAVKDAIVGVGTALNAEQLAAAQQVGAQFAVSPGLTPALAESARKLGLPLLPGTMTPSDVIRAMELGYRQLKFFPAQQAGGVDALAAFGSVFGEVKFCPTGGITATSAPQFLELPNVACVGGSWLTPKNLLQSNDWEAIHKLARDASALKEKENRLTP